MEILAIFTCHNRRELTKRGIETLSRNENVTFHYVVVDDGSTDGTKEMLQELPEQIVHRLEQLSGIKKVTYLSLV